MSVPRFWRELDSRYNLGLSPDEVNELFAKIKDEMDKMNRDGDKPIVLVSPVIRRYVRRFLDPVFSQITVLSYSELPPTVPLDTVGKIEIIAVLYLIKRFIFKK